jgi:hypothetical protein
MPRLWRAKEGGGRTKCSLGNRAPGANARQIERGERPTFSDDFMPSLCAPADPGFKDREPTERARGPELDRVALLLERRKLVGHKRREKLARRLLL